MGLHGRAAQLARALWKARAWVTEALCTLSSAGGDVAAFELNVELLASAREEGASTRVGEEAEETARPRGSEQWWEARSAERLRKDFTWFRD